MLQRGSENPELFGKIAKEIQEKIKNGEDQMTASMEVMGKYQNELKGFGVIINVEIKKSIINYNFSVISISFNCLCFWTRNYKKPILSLKELIGPTKYKVELIPIELPPNEFDDVHTEENKTNNIH